MGGKNRIKNSMFYIVRGLGPLKHFKNDHFIYFSPGKVGVKTVAKLRYFPDFFDLDP